ncbi:MAG: hypothetical protein ACYCS8_05340 [Acidithiobacillus sp.]
MNAKSKIKMTLNIEVTADQPVAVGPRGYDYEQIFEKGEKATKVIGLPRFGRSYGHDTQRYLQASTMRHILRENASVFVAQALADAGRELTASQVMALVAGYTESAGKAKDKTKAKISHLDAYERNVTVHEKNPILDMFGFGLGMGGILRVGNLFPRPVQGRQPWHVYGGYVRKALSDNALRVANPETVKGYFDMLDRQSGSKAESDDKNGLKNMGGAYEEFLPGTVFDHRITLVQGDLIRLGLIMAALESFSDDPVIGAHSSLGRGLVSMRGELNAGDNHGSFYLAEGIFQPEGSLREALGIAKEAAANGFPEHDFTLLPSGGEEG